VEGFPDLTVPGQIGCVAVLLEEDNTPEAATAAGHDALNLGLQRELDAAISRLSIEKQDVTPDEVKAMRDAVTDAATRAVEQNVDVWPWITAGANMDDILGVGIFRFSMSELRDAPPSGRTLSVTMGAQEDNLLLRHIAAALNPTTLVASALEQAFASNGEWSLSGRVTAHPVPYRMSRLLVAGGQDPRRGMRQAFASAGVSSAGEYIEKLA
jgi:hypothetical protein